MSYAVKIGTTQAWWIGDAPTPPGCVRFDGDLAIDIGTVQIVWDSDLQNVRALTPGEFAEIASTKQRSVKREALTAKLLEAIADAMISDKAPTDPVLIEVAAKLAAEIEDAKVI